MSTAKLSNTLRFQWCRVELFVTFVSAPSSSSCLVPTGNLKLVSSLPGKYSSGTSFCEKIALLNNLMAVQVSGDGHCQYNAVIRCLKAANYSESFTVELLRQTVYSTISSNVDFYSRLLWFVGLKISISCQIYKMNERKLLYVEEIWQRKAY